MGDALVAVHRAHGDKAAEVWKQLLAAAGLAGHETSDAALDRLLTAMSALDPLSKVIARGLRVRIDTYVHLTMAQHNLASVKA
jgi:hypothetical protein